LIDLLYFKSVHICDFRQQTARYNGIIEVVTKTSISKTNRIFV